MPTVKAYTTYRGQPVLIHEAVSPLDGSPIGLAFTLARTRNACDKLYSAVPTLNSGADSVAIIVPADELDLKPGRYWWDIWRTDPDQEEVLAIGYLDIKAAVRTPTDCTDPTSATTTTGAPRFGWCTRCH